jgi:cell division septation protein DedD
MTDIRADDPALDRDDRLPWLEAIEEDEGSDGPSALKLIVAVLIGLVAIGALVGGAFWLANRAGGASTASGEPELIKAQPGDYKSKPDNPGGMNVSGEGDTAFAASAGGDPKGQINANAVPEAPVTQTRGQAPQAQPADQGVIKAPPPTNAPAKAPANAQASAPAAKPSAPAATPAAAGGSIQLGAFPTSAEAERSWKAMSGRFGYLAPLSHSVVSAQVNGKTWYRLRAGGADAAGICGRLRVAGVSCFRVD